MTDEKQDSRLDSDQIATARVHAETSLQNEKTKSRTAIIIALIGTLSGWGTVLFQSLQNDRIYTEADLQQKIQEAQPVQYWMRIRGLSSTRGTDVRLVFEVDGAVYVYPSRADYISTEGDIPEAEYPLPVGEKFYNLRVTANGVGCCGPEEVFYVSRTVNFPAETTANLINVELDGVHKGRKYGLSRKGNFKGVEFDAGTSRLVVQFDVLSR